MGPSCVPYCVSRVPKLTVPDFQASWTQNGDDRNQAANVGASHFFPYFVAGKLLLTPQNPTQDFSEPGSSQ